MPEIAVYILRFQFALERNNVNNTYLTTNPNNGKKRKYNTVPTFINV